MTDSMSFAKGESSPLKIRISVGDGRKVSHCVGHGMAHFSTSADNFLEEFDPDALVSFGARTNVVQVSREAVYVSETQAHSVFIAESYGYISN
jgi:hypothetical protein